MQLPISIYKNNILYNNKYQITNIINVMNLKNIKYLKPNAKHRLKTSYRNKEH